MGYNRKTHGDFKMVYCKEQKRHYWLLGYFGGGGWNVSDAMKLAEEFSKEHNTSIENIFMEEIERSRWCKYFKVIYSDLEKTDLPHPEAIAVDNAWAWFRL